MFAQKPAIAELIISLDQFDTIAFSEAQFIGAASEEVV
jgi:hypothetical protein